MIEEVKKAKDLLNQKVSLREIEDQTGITRTAVKDLVELYDLMNASRQLKDKGGEYVRVKKKRYMLQKIKMQHKIHDLRDRYLRELEVLKNKYKKTQDLIDKKEAIEDLELELHNKQKMLDITSSNLQHAEDHYEYMKKNMWITKILYASYGAAAGAVFVTSISFLFRV